MSRTHPLARLVLDVLEKHGAGLTFDQVRICLDYPGARFATAEVSAALASLAAADLVWSVEHRVRDRFGRHWEPVYFIPSPAELARHRAASAAATVPGPDRRADGGPPGVPRSDRGARPV